MPPTVRIQLLGPPRVERDGVPVVFDTRKAMALLAHLCLADGARPRDALADLLWPDADLGHARGALRRTLSSLRTGLGSEHLEATRDLVRLVRGPDLVVDADAFRRDLAEGDAEGALEIYRGELLEGFAMRDAPDFEEWWDAQASTLAREHTGALASVAAGREASGDLAGAVTVVRRWLALDPLHEPAHQQLMRLLARSGDRAAALVHYRECVRILSRELGVPPLRETTELYEAINLGTVTTQPVTAPPRRGGEDSAAPVARPPLVGREQDLQALLAARTAATETGRVVVVEGEPGIGRSRLVDELAVATEAAGGVVLRGRAYADDARLPYRPVIDLLNERLGGAHDWLGALDDATLAEAARLVPALATAVPARRLPPPLAPEDPGAEARFLAAVWDTLTAAVSGSSGGLLVLDDAQWADEATMRLLRFGLRRLEGRPLLLVLVWLTPYEHEVRSAALVASRDRGAAVVLPRLDEAEVGQVVALLAPDSADASTVRRLWKTSEGVPRILVELLRADAGSGVPAGVREALQERLAGLGEAASQLLAAAAVVGRSFDVDTLRAVSGRSEEETVTGLEELVGLGLLRESVTDYDFDHGLLRTVVHDATSRARRRLLHGRAAGLAGVAAAETARHLQLAGRDAEAAPAYKRAGDAARQVFAHAEALEHYAAALALGHPDHSALATVSADMQVTLGDYAGALVSLEDAAAVATPTELAVIEHRLGRLHLRRGEFSLAEAHLLAALPRAGDDAVRSEVVADQALAVLSLGELDRARRLADEALALAGSDVRASGRAHQILGQIRTADGHHGAALDHLEQSLELAESLGADDLRVATLNDIALVHRERGSLDTALELTSTALALCARLGDRHREAALHNNVADLLHALGRGDEAMDHLKSAVEIFAEVGQRDARDATDEPRPAIWRLVRW